MKVIVHITSHDSWSGVRLEDTKTYKTVRGAEAFCRRFNAKNNLPQVPSYYETARIASIGGRAVL